MIIRTCQVYRSWFSMLGHLPDRDTAYISRGQVESGVAEIRQQRPWSYRSYHFFCACLGLWIFPGTWAHNIRLRLPLWVPTGSDVILLWLFNKIKNADCPKANLEGKYDLAQWSGRLPREYYCREYSAFEERWTQPGPTVKLHRSSLQGGCGKVRLIGTLENERSQEVEWDLRQS